MNARTPLLIVPRCRRRRLLALAVLGVAAAALGWKLVGSESAPRYTGPPTWSAAGRMAEARSGHAAIVLPNGEVLVAGGYGADQLLASAEVFDPRTKQWQRTGAPPVPQAPTVALLLATGKVLLGVGGTGPPKPHDRPRALRSGARHVGACPPAPSRRWPERQLAASHANGCGTGARACARRRAESGAHHELRLSV
jgi:peptidoglycan/LPS O-acetylase OafA/YrhL